jgi:aminoglycoside phosphotransferase (APT) family kinase protein
VSITQTAVDALALVAATARAALGTTIGRLPLGGGDFPHTVDGVTARWLEDVLQAHAPGVRVPAARRLDATSGTTDRVRVAVTYAAAPEHPAMPATFFIKLAPAATLTRIFGELMELGATEVRFYREIAPALPIAAPRAYAARRGRRAGYFALVLEDLVTAGATFTDVAGPLSVATARTVVGVLARLHAAFWESPRFGRDLAWLRAPDRNPTLRLERALCAAAVRPGLARFPELVPDAVRAAAPRIVAARDRLDAFSAERPRTLIHGDSHSGNLYFVGDDVGFLDWQITQCGPGMRDVTYFLISSLETDLRRAHERALIAHYLDELARHGVAAPSHEDAWREHRLHAFHTWIATIVTAAAATLQVEAIARAGVARSSRALVDLDSLAALDALERQGT